MPITQPSLPFPPHCPSPESITSATRHSGACSGAILCKASRKLAAETELAWVYTRKHPEPAQMIPSLQDRELRDEKLLRRVGSEQAKSVLRRAPCVDTPAEIGSSCPGTLDSRSSSRSAYTKNQRPLPHIICTASLCFAIASLHTASHCIKLHRIASHRITINSSPMHSIARASHLSISHLSRNAKISMAAGFPYPCGAN